MIKYPEKILMITTRPLIPNLDGYTIRMYNLLKGLKINGADITLMSFVPNNNENLYSEEYNLICNKFIPIVYDRKKSYKNCLKAIFSGKPFKAEYFNIKEAKEVIRNEVENNNYDYICGYHYLTAQFLDMFPKHKRWIELCDSISMLHERNINNSKSFFEKLFLMTERKRVLRIEKKCIEKYDFLTLISDVDKSYLSKYFNTDKISIIKNGTDITDIISENYNKNEICFLGCMSYFQNHKAVMWFIEEILPGLVKKYPNIIFKVIGKEPKNELLKTAENNKNIVVTGMVDDVTKELVSANFMVCPIKVSAGIQNKILEAMEKGVPVIATDSVIKPITDEKAIIISANSKEEWLEKISELIDNPDKRNFLSKKSKEYIKQHYSWNYFSAQLRDYLDNA